MAASRRVIATIGKIIATIVAAALLWGVGWLLWWLKARLPIGWDDPNVIGFFVVLTAAVLLGIWWLWWRLPQHYVARLAIQIHDPKARADTEDNFRKTVGQALGGIAVLIGAGVAYLQFTQQQQATRDQLRAAHDLLISNQVSKGFEQLAGNETAMRLGGIYALEGVMNASPEYHQPILEALCAFVRDGTIDKTVGKAPATDIQAVLTVIGRRKSPDRDQLWSVNFAHANIPGAALNVAYLSDAWLINANLSGAILGGASLINAYLSDANLSGAYLTGAYLHIATLSNAKLNGAKLNGADLSDAKLNGAHLSGAYLSGADLSGAYLDFADLSNADLSGADLSKAKNLTQAQLDQACGTYAKLPRGMTLKPCPK